MEKFEVQEYVNGLVNDYLNGSSLSLKSKFFYPLMKNYFNNFKIIDSPFFEKSNSLISTFSNKKFLKDEVYSYLLASVYSDYSSFLNKHKGKRKVIKTKKFEQWVNNPSHLKSVLKLRDYLKNVEGIKSFLLQGSLSTFDYYLGWSDLDTFLIIKKGFLSNPLRLRKLRNFIFKSRAYFYLTDSLQHHGHIIIGEEEMKSYDQSILPFKSIEKATCLLGEDKLVFFEDSHFSSLPLIKLKNFVEQELRENKIHSLFFWKLFLHLALLSPSFYLQAKGIFVYKKDSFRIAKKDFSNDDWKVIEEISNLRKNGFFKRSNLLLFIQKFLVHLPNPRVGLYFSYLFNKKVNESEKKRILIAFRKLCKKMIEKVEEK